MMSDMMQMMHGCCGEDGVPDLERMKGFMQMCGKTEFTEEEMQMMRQFCSRSGKLDAEEMKQLMEKCGC